MARLALAIRVRARWISVVLCLKYDTYINRAIASFFMNNTLKIDFLNTFVC